MLRTPLHFQTIVRQLVPQPAVTASAQTGTDTLAGKIYQLYLGEPRYLKWNPDQFLKAAKFIKDLWSEVKDHDTLRNGYLQYSTQGDMKYYVNHGVVEDADKDKPLMLGDLCVGYAKKMRLDSDPQLKEDFESLCADFIYFVVENKDITYRVYANVKFDSAIKVVKYLKLIITHEPGYIIHFKVVGPDYFFGGRADTIVIYCENEHKADGIALALADEEGLRNAFNVEVPAMTKLASPGIGVSTGAEPEYQATGMQKRPGKLAYKRNDLRGNPVWTPTNQWLPEAQAGQSFGSIRSELIAMAILNFNENKGLVGFGDTFEVFKKFVAVAFRSYGLNPSEASL